jgi:hypothetical protein
MFPTATRSAFERVVLISCPINEETEAQRGSETLPQTSQLEAKPGRGLNPAPESEPMWVSGAGRWNSW